MLEEIELLETKTNLMYGLPHLYGWKWYTWAREFFESTNKQNFLCAANQLSKSSTQIRKVIHWATEETLWPRLWARKPSQFWYLYPSQEVVNIEFKLKWEKEFLPRGEYKAHEKYGWKEIKDRDNIVGIKFNSGVYVFFKTYTKNVQHLQTGSVDALFCDEELPVYLYDELTNRTNATDGYFHMVFTATLGQDLWRRTMEHGDEEEEAFPTAAKWTVSLYESMFYEDGTRSHWSEAKIAAVKAKCATHAEVLKRVMGRFVHAEGREFPTFNAAHHMKPPHHVPTNWLIYSGVDIGSGGTKGHPSAIVFVAVRPDHRDARVIAGWRGDGVETTDSDVVLKYIELKKEYNLKPVAQYYDWSSKDFEIIATRMGESFLKADKSHEKGKNLLNTLFKNDMLFIYETQELAKLGAELSALRIGANRTKAKNDFADALRYALSNVPFDFSGLTGTTSEYTDTPEAPLTAMEQEVLERRRAFDSNSQEADRIEAEFEEWNSLY